MSSLSCTSSSHAIQFIVLEGIDTSGKTTQAQLLVTWCRERGLPVMLTREPGGTALGERLRALVLDPDLPCTARAELLLMQAARAQHVAEVITPALRDGTIVISDRFSLSSLAYQGYGRGLPLDDIRAADHTATGGVQPDVTLFVDVPLEIALDRLGARRDRFEGNNDFLARVIDGYRRLAETEPHVCRIDGAGTIAEIQQAIRRELAQCDARFADGGDHI